MIDKKGSSRRITGLGEAETRPAAHNAVSRSIINSNVTPTGQAARAAIRHIQSWALMSMPSTANTVPLCGSISGTRALNHVPQWSEDGPTTDAVFDSKTCRSSAEASP
ncbi:hypothetical protein SDC9_155654 [bioreactor metagenome]|uniref:Uncharacterized protein n=1 Tax=bioreactor metagenome TaxID=1076179 RepID=A0A645F4C5_9ZZZZ